MSTELTLDDLLAIENDESILAFKCPATGMVLWPLARPVILRLIISDLLYKAPLSVSVKKKPYGRILRSVSRAVAHNIINKGKIASEVSIFATGGGMFIKDGRYFDRLSDHFALALHGRTVVVEDLSDWRWPFPRYNERVLFHTPIQLSSALTARLALRPFHSKMARGIVEYAMDRVKNLLGWDFNAKACAHLEKFIAYQVASTPARFSAYQKLLKRIGARVVIREEGCYGSSAVFNFAVKSLGLILAEHQHGGVSSGHDAYNIAPVLRNSEEYRATLPEFFLGYGSWWNSQIKVPVKKFSIGNPHRSEQIRMTNHNDIKRDILILGDGIETDMYLALADRLARNLGSNNRVVFRPHPLERRTVFARCDKEEFVNVALDRNEDIYESFRSAHVVVSEASTGLFEAVGLVDRIFVWGNAKARFWYPVHPFGSFYDGADLVKKIRGGSEGYVDTQAAEEIWASGWRENYFQFLRLEGGIAC